MLLDVGKSCQNSEKSFLYKRLLLMADVKLITVLSTTVFHYYTGTFPTSLFAVQGKLLRWTYLKKMSSCFEVKEWIRYDYKPFYWP